MRLPPSSSRPTSRAGVACAVAVLLVDLWSFANGQLLDPSAGTALGAAAANLAGGGLREASNLLQETGLGASFAEAGGAAAKAAVGALAAGTNADIRTLPNANGKPGGGGAAASSRQQTERHKELDRASEAIGSGRQQVLGGGGGGGASIFSMMGTAPGAELTSAASAPKDYVPKPYREEDRGTRDAAASGAAASAASAASSDGERSIGPFPVPNQPGTGGAGFDPRSGGGGGGDASFAPGAKSFPGSGDAPRSSLYATNDAGTGPAPVSGGGFQPLESGGGFADGGKVMSGGGGVGGGGGVVVGGGGGGGGGGKSATPLLGGGGGGSAPASAGGSSVAPAPLVGGAVVGQDGRASLPVNSFAQQQPQQPQQQQPPQPPQPQSSNGGVGSDGLVHAPGGAASAPLGVVDTQPTTTAVTGTAPGGLPFKMTIGRRRRRRRRSRMAMA